MSNISVLTDETFDDKRPGYKEGSESSRGPMVTTYVTSDWTKTPEVKQKETPPSSKPVEKPTQEPLPQPKVDDKPSPIPQTKKDNVGDVFKTISPKEIDGQKFITTQEYQTAADDLYKRKEKEWKDTQKEMGKNILPGEGTRNRFELDSNKELSNILKNNNINIKDEIPSQPLQEKLTRIKTLMLLIN
jgi:hypothetical protein